MIIAFKTIFQVFIDIWELCNFRRNADAIHWTILQQFIFEIIECHDVISRIDQRGNACRSVSQSRQHVTSGKPRRRGIGDWFFARSIYATHDESVSGRFWFCDWSKSFSTWSFVWTSCSSFRVSGIRRGLTCRARRFDSRCLRRDCVLRLTWCIQFVVTMTCAHVCASRVHRSIVNERGFVSSIIDRQLHCMKCLIWPRLILSITLACWYVTLAIIRHQSTLAVASSTVIWTTITSFDGARYTWELFDIDRPPRIFQRNFCIPFNSRHTKLQDFDMALFLSSKPKNFLWGSRI